jgi:hypothetical protein
MNSCLDLAKDIKTMDFLSPDFENEVACKIKKLIHEEKYHVYYRMFLHLKYGPRKARHFKKSVKGHFTKFLKDKVKTHDEFKNREWRKQIWGLYDWHK